MSTTPVKSSALPMPEPAMGVPKTAGGHHHATNGKKVDPSLPLADPNNLERALAATALPKSLVNRLRKDAQDCPEYRRLCGVEHLRADKALFADGAELIQVPSVLHLQAPPLPAGFDVVKMRSIKEIHLSLPPALAQYLTLVPNVAALDAAPANSSKCGHSMSCFVCCCRGARFVGQGQMAALHDKDDDVYTFQRNGYHSYNSCGVDELGLVSTNTYNQAVTFGHMGFVNITEGNVGRVCVSGVYSFLPEGVWQWNSPEVQFLGCNAAVSNGKVTGCGTAGFVIIPEGYIAVIQVDTTYRFYPHGIYQWNNPHIKFHSTIKIDYDVCHSFGATGWVSISEGNMGLVRIGNQVHFLQQGTFQWTSPNVQFLNVMHFELDRVIQQAATGFVTISEGKVGVMQVGSDFRLLVQGTYVWNSPSVMFHHIVDISNNQRCTSLGPYTLVLVPDGDAALTYNNGVLNVLSAIAANGSSAGPSVDEEGAPCSTYFLSHPKWRFEEMLSLQMQTDKLEGNNLLSKDNVELIMVAMSQWRIADPVLAATHCAPNMDKIRTTVNDLIRATISRIVAGTAIGAGPVGGAMPQAAVVGKVVDSDGSVGAAGDEEMGLAQLMQSEGATKHMGDLSANLNAMGIEVVGVFVPEKRMKNDDIRKEVAKQAVIGIKAEAERAAADAKAYATVKSSHAEAEAERAGADARAYTIVKKSHAEAEAIELVAKARGEAGRALGDPTTTASRLALTEATTNAYKDAKMTIFSGAPKEMPFMMTQAPPGL
eukprot:52628_1